MLPKSQAVFVYTETRQEEIYSPNEITKSLIIDNTLKEKKIKIIIACGLIENRQQLLDKKKALTTTLLLKLTFETASPRQILFAD